MAAATAFRRLSCLASVCLVFLVAQASTQEAQRKFRTDAEGHYKPDELKKLKSKAKAEVLPWYQLVEGQFPPAGSAHAISGELIQVDHLERRFHLRVDRNDSQDRGVWDLPLDAVLLPYGSIYYHGSPAALQDLPLGTHLHGLFYLRAPDDTTPYPDTSNQRKTPESDFRRCFLLEDDFTHHARQQQLWKIDAVDHPGLKLTATLQHAGKAVGKPAQFDLLSSTRVLKDKGFVPLAALQPGQQVLLNLTWVTLYGPGRITDIWLDEPSRQGATAQQLERHRNHIRERGLAGWVTAVDDKEEIVTVQLFGGVDAKLLEEIALVPPSETPAAGSAPAQRPSLAVARASLMTYDPVNDRKRGTLLELKKIPVEPGSSGVQVKLKMDMLLEGYRPRRVVRLYPATWKVQALPREEQFFGRE